MISFYDHYIFRIVKALNMLKFDKTNRTLSKLSETNFKKENLLERTDLQAAIVSSWDAFRNEIGFSSAVLIGQEINPDDSTSDRLDILALDAEDSSLIIFELKRYKNKLQLLQGLTYAAMASSKTKDELRSIASAQKCYEYEELLEILDTTELQSDIKIVLIAEAFHPEVIITADWLTNYGITIYAFAIDVHNVEGETHLRFEQRYPLKELTDVYESRKKRADKPELKQLSWNDVISTCEYSFAERAISMCRLLQEGDPSRKRFVRIVKEFEGFQELSFMFRRKHVNVYLKGGNEELFEELINKLPQTISDKTGSWRDGYSFQITKEDEFDALVQLDGRFGS